MSDLSFFHHLTLSTPLFSSEEESLVDRASITPVKLRRPIAPQQAQTPSRLIQNDDTTSDWSDLDSSEGKTGPARGIFAGTTPTG